MAFDWDEQIKQQIDTFNRKLMTPNPALGYVEGGMKKPAGLIPGPVNMATGDDTMTPTKMGEYIIPVEAVLAIGKGLAPNSQLSPEDALALGKQHLDQTVTGLKQSMGNNAPVRNAGPAGIPQTGFVEGGGVGADYPVAGADFPKAGIDPATGKPWPVAGADFPKAGLQPRPTPQPQPQPQPKPGYAEGGMKTGEEAANAAPTWQDPATIPVPDVTSPAAAAQSVAAPAGIPDPAAVQPAADVAPVPAGLPQTASNPNAVLLKVGAGETGTGYEPAVTVTNGNVDKLAGLNQSRGVVADSPNNLPDLANSVKDLKATSSGTDIVNGRVGLNQSPILEMRGTLDPTAAGKISDRVDWSPGSQNVKDAEVNAQYKEEVAKAVKVNLASGLAPSPEQIKTLGMAPADVANLLAVNNPDGRFDKAIAAGLETAKNVNAAALQQSEIERNKSFAGWRNKEVQTMDEGTKLIPNVTTADGKPVFSNQHSQVFTMDDKGAPVIYTGKTVPKPGLNVNMNALNSEEQVAINTAVAEKRLDPYKVNSRNQKTLAGIELAHPGTDLNRISGDLGVARNKDVVMRAGIAEMIPGLLQNVATAGKALNYSDAQFVGVADQWLKGQSNDPKLAEYMSARNDLLLTLGQVMRGNAMTDMAQKLEEQAARPTMSPTAIDGWLKGQMSSVDPRLKMYRALLSGAGVMTADQHKAGLQPGGASGGGVSPQVAPAGTQANHGGKIITSDGKGGWV